MRVLTSLLVVATLAPLSACYVGNAPPVSRRADASPAAADAGAPEAPAEEADSGATPAPEPELTDLCASDDECGDDGRCVRPEGSIARCELLPRPAADAGAPDAGPSACEQLCAGRQCGITSSDECGVVRCGTCGEGFVCAEGFGRCDPAPYTGPLWLLRVASSRVDRCDTSWDQCRNGGQPLCSPTLPDPFVRVNGMITAPAGNRCEGTYNAEVGVIEEPRLGAGVDFVLEDDDSPISNVRSGDVVCRGRLTATPAELAAGSKTIVCAGGSVTFRFERRR